MFASAFKTLTPFFAPPQCEVCEAHLNEATCLCRLCEHKIQALPINHCMICAEPFASPESSAHLCEVCLKQRPAFSKVWAAYLYEGPVPALVHQAKLKRRPLGLLKLAKQSESLFVRVLQQFQPDLILPVPLSFWRSFKRGYNQSYLLAKAWRQSFEGAPSISLIAKRCHTKPLATQNRRERLKLLKNAFRVSLQAVSQKRILLIDDVMTTGATAQALSQALLQAGAQEVAVLVLARTAKRL